MKRFFTLAFSGLISLTAVAQPKPAIIPKPVKMVTKPGSFTLPKTFTICAPAKAADASAYLFKRLMAAGFKVSVKPGATGPVKMMLLTKSDPVIGTEGYYLTSTAQGVVIKANESAGLFYGAQTLMQLLPAAVQGTESASDVKWTIPHVQITDYPRFAWRGLMFDVVRHYFTKAEIKRFIDEMVQYKFNVLHLHLADDEGWRIEIKSLPKLTQIGAWRVNKVGDFGTFTPPKPDEPRNYGGFYTQDDIREIVAYAKANFVNVMPEIDVPGHSLAAIASYPELSCTPGADQYHVRSGERIMNFSGGLTALVDNTLCPANERVYTFLDKVVGEMAPLFPFPYMHMGGDECAKNFWEQSDSVKALMQREGLKDMEQVQSYFEKRLEKIVESKGKKFMGWDEIIEGGLGPNAAVMSWRNQKAGMDAAKMGHEVVMTPTAFTYLDYMQSDRVTEPHVYASLRLNKTYEFDPVPADTVDSKLIMGGQANLWTEQIYNFRQVEYMLWPRAMAVSESVWSAKGSKNWTDFFGRVEKHFTRLDDAEIKYSPAVYDPAFSPSIAPGNQLRVELSTEIPGLDIYYSFDNSYPDKFYPRYTMPLIVPKDAGLMRVITYRGGKPIGRMISMPISELNTRAKRVPTP
ncbi:hexosaminidase [Mucilaginibacter yixingensis]|uniref:beta-N-acetylhexosaminidase n=1 Tax=Mucilaginibacter yixingensis TaxID=1295612 RepID=A0A2T5JDX9_9SPHI|nr:family 20 glycosylhydrolase [Mucilaginibacter yixingensis]PTQ99964.1 hexosaminidase [Mucilaginibacter yixingensis]